VPILGRHDADDDDEDAVAPHVVAPPALRSALKPSGPAHLVRDAQPGPLLVRNLDTAPRGSITPALRHDDPKLRMTNPWKRMEWGAAEKEDAPEPLQPMRGLVDAKDEEERVEHGVSLAVEGHLCGADELHSVCRSRPIGKLAQAVQRRMPCWTCSRP
jgi:hypothetical protein